MEKAMKTAQVLVEALPYIKKFSGKTVVIKYGGHAMTNDIMKEKVISDIVLMKFVGINPVIVHGGGPAINYWVEKNGGEPEFVNGLRVTDKDTMEVAEMVLNKINKGLVSMMEKVGVKAVGISGKDGSVLRVKKKLSKGEDIGFVGEVTKVNTELLNTLLDNDFVPVICPIGSDDEYHSYNINADDAACAIATAVGASKLVFLTDIEGVYRDPQDKSTLISELSIPEAEELLGSGNIGGGMLPKIQNCVDAIKSGVSRVHILDGRIPHCLLLEFYTNKGIGTAIIGDEEERFYNENE